MQHHQPVPVLSEKSAEQTTLEPEGYEEGGGEAAERYASPDYGKGEAEEDGEGSEAFTEPEVRAIAMRFSTPCSPNLMEVHFKACDSA